MRRLAWIAAVLVVGGCSDGPRAGSAMLAQVCPQVTAAVRAIPADSLEEDDYHALGARLQALADSADAETADVLAPLIVASQGFSNADPVDSGIDWRAELGHVTFRCRRSGG